MAEYIECRKCDSPYCDGCNVYTLATMLRAGKFDRLMDEHHSVKFIEAEPVKHGRWKETKNGFRCSQCKREPGLHPTRRGAFLSKFCPNCGAKMDLEEDYG